MTYRKTPRKVYRKTQRKSKPDPNLFQIRMGCDFFEFLSVEVENLHSPFLSGRTKKSVYPLPKMRVKILAEGQTPKYLSRKCGQTEEIAIRLKNNLVSGKVIIQDMGFYSHPGQPSYFLVYMEFVDIPWMSDP